VSALTGSCYTTKRDIFNKLGGFDKIYGLGTFEDADYCLKVKQLGLRIYIRADAIGYHYVGATAEKRQTPFPLQINSMIFKSRWAGTGLMQWDEWLFW
jgi:GT2 family glycosyltransferase